MPKLKLGDQILLEFPEVRPLEVLPQPFPLEVVYEDGDLLVVNKPKGMVVHPAPGHEERHSGQRAACPLR